MSFYSIYLIEELIALYPLEQEYIAIAQKGRLIATLKGYQSAWETAIALAEAKQLHLIDCTKVQAAMHN